MGEIGREVRRLGGLAAPVAATQLSSMLLWTVDLLMVGRLGVASLNAVSLGRFWVMGTTTIALGLIFGLDPIAAQAHGARDRKRLGDVLLHGLLLALLVSIPLALFWLGTRPILLAFGQDPETAALAAEYVRVQIPALPFFLLYMVLRQFLQARGIVRPAMWVAFGANLFNVALNAPLIYGLWGLPRLGAVGAGVATAITQVAMLVALLLIFRRLRLGRGVRAVFSTAALRVKGLTEIVGLGTPVAFQLALEYWAFAIVTLWAGRMGATELAAHSIAINLASISYMVPFGISIGATTRVGNLIGAGQPAAAQRAAWVALGLGGGTMLGFALFFVLGREVIPAAYTSDATVIALAASLLPIAAAFEAFDGLQAVGGGVLRGMGSTRPAAIANLLGYYALGLPLGWWLGRPERLGLAGLWWGLAIGLATVATILVLRIAVAGPRTAVALAGRARANGDVVASLPDERG